ncbi:MAG: hypothetical protein WAV41_04375 [Microgenomates group bacterium]
MKNKKIWLAITLISALTLSACGTKTPTPVKKPLPTVVKMVEMPVATRPIVNLTPRQDGHMLFLKLTDVSANISSIEYELIYTATDGSLEMEKGLGDTIKEISNTIERKLLLGTESCTNGCKYKYDEGITGGTLSLKLFTVDGQASSFETPFILKSGAQLTKEKIFKLPTANFEVPITSKLSSADFFVLMKQYKGGYSIFSSNPSPIAKDYPQP